MRLCGHLNATKARRTKMPKRRNYNLAAGCPVEVLLNLINGRWKGVILYHLMHEGTLRFGQLQRITRGCSPRLLSKQLRELESDGFIHREVYAVVPPKVEYSLTNEGVSIGPLLKELHEWGCAWLGARGLNNPPPLQEQTHEHALIANMQDGMPNRLNSVQAGA
jgi:DNA-binding HxlR family transcriptional regulator